MKLFLSLVLFLTFLINLQSFANEGDSTLGKFYISASTLHPTDHGLYVEMEDEFLPVEGVFVDLHGLYILSPQAKKGYPQEVKPWDGVDRCTNGHPIYHKECKGCGNWWCNFRCKCHSPWL